MRKKISIIFLLLSICLLGLSENVPSSIINITQNENSITIYFNLPNYTLRDTSVLDPYGISEIFKYISIDYFGTIDDIGYPQLPQLTFDLKVPDGSNDFQINASNQVVSTIAINRRFLPTQDDYETQQNFQINSSYYSSNGALYNFISQLSDPYIVFGAQGISVSIFPFTYNPQSNLITVLTQATFTLSYSLESRKGIQLTDLSDVKGCYLSKFFENYSYTKGSSDLGGRYLMITAPAFESTLQSFASFKRNYGGYEVTVVNTNVTGTTVDDIKDYIQTLYDSPTTRPDFVILVGDHGNIPASGGNSSGDDIDDPITDLNYARLDGSDYFVDVLLGRFSVSTTDELQNIINKCIYMELNLHLLDKKAKFLAGHDYLAWVENQFENGHNAVIDDTFEPEGYVCQKLYQPTTTQAVNAISDNPLFYIYSGHGDFDEMAGGSFSITSTQINSATNTVYPFVFSFACLTGNFAYPSVTSIGEHWIRSEKGGIAYFGSSVITYVNSDKAIEKKIFGDAFTDEEHLSAIINLGMKRYWNRFWSWLNRTRTRRYMKAYNLLGDPSFNILGIACPYDIIFSDNETFESGTLTTFNASHDIYNNESFLVLDGADVTLLAGNSITLNPGFEVDLGGIFEARAEPCDEGSAKSSEYQEDTFKYNIYEETVITDEEQIINSTPLSIFPNPTNSDFSVCYTLDNEKFVKFEIYDIFGSKIKTLLNLYNLEDGEYSLSFSLNDLVSGTYIFVFTTDKRKISGKLIKN